LPRTEEVWYITNVRCGTIPNSTHNLKIILEAKIRCSLHQGNSKNYYHPVANVTNVTISSCFVE
jgi:hypothetical protein